MGAKRMAKAWIQAGDILHQQMVDGVRCVCFPCTKQQATSALGCIPKPPADAHSHIPVNHDETLQDKSSI